MWAVLLQKNPELLYIIELMSEPDTSRMERLHSLAFQSGQAVGSVLRRLTPG